MADNRMGNIPQNSSNSPAVAEKIRDADPEQLRFLRWLAEQNRIEHKVFGPPSGEYTA